MTPAPAEFNVLEIVKTVLLTLITLGVAWIARTVFLLRDDVRDFKREMPELRADVAEALKRIKLVEDRNLVIDAVAEIEEKEYPGDERRHGLRSLREMIRSELRVLFPREST